MAATRIPGLVLPVEHLKLPLKDQVMVQVAAVTEKVIEEVWRVGRLEAVGLAVGQQCGSCRRPWLQLSRN